MLFFHLCCQSKKGKIRFARLLTKDLVLGWRNHLCNETCIKWQLMMSEWCNCMLGKQQSTHQSFAQKLSIPAFILQALGVVYFGNLFFIYFFLLEGMVGGWVFAKEVYGGNDLGVLMNVMATAKVIWWTDLISWGACNWQNCQPWCQRLKTFPNIGIMGFKVEESYHLAPVWCNRGERQITVEEYWKRMVKELWRPSMP